MKRQAVRSRTFHFTKSHPTSQYVTKAERIGVYYDWIGCSLCLEEPSSTTRNKITKTLLSHPFLLVL